MTMPDIAFHGQRSLSDLLEAERSMRAASDETVRGLRDVLLSVANRLDGKRMEALRHVDPKIPGNWSAKQWKEFVDAIPTPDAWGAMTTAAISVSNNEENSRYVEELKAEIQNLMVDLENANTRIADMEKQQEAILLKTVRKNPVELKPMPSTRPNGYVFPPLDALVHEAESRLLLFPNPPGKLMNGLVSVGSRDGKNRLIFLQRVFVSLFALGARGISNTLELNHLVALPGEAQPNSGSVGKVLNDIEKNGLIAIERFEMSEPKSTLKVAKLTEKGEALFKGLFPKEKLIESEVSASMQWAHNDRFRATALMYFAALARKRGYYTSMNSNQESDLWLGRGEESKYTILVDSLTDNRSQALAKLNNGKTCICATNKSIMERVAGNCGVSGIGGEATDLETILTHKYVDITPNDPLWRMTW